MSGEAEYLNGLPKLGHNDGNVVFCGLCNWQRTCDTFEQIEFFLAQHLSNVHGRRILIKRDEESGEVRDVPS